MHFSKLLTPVFLFASMVIASPLVVRQCTYNCGGQCYSSGAASDAANAGYGYYEEDSEAGGSDYPHTYEDYEGFTFPVSGPYQEFPIMADGSIYDGGSPGADRVIFNTEGQLAGVITHTGASGNDFVSC